MFTYANQESFLKNVTCEKMKIILVHLIFVQFFLLNCVNSEYQPPPQKTPTGNGYFQQTPLQQQVSGYGYSPQGAPAVKENMNQQPQQQQYPSQFLPYQVPQQQPYSQPQQPYNSYSAYAPYQKYDKGVNPAPNFGIEGTRKHEGDRAARKGEFPFTVQFRINGVYHAVGSLVRSPITGKQVIITAAHVMTEKNSTDPVPIDILTVRMGNIGRDDPGQELPVLKSLIHPEYEVWHRYARPVFHDIAIVIADGHFVENEYVHSIELPNFDTHGAFDEVTALGWDRKREAGPNSLLNMLRVVNVPVWDNQHCDQVYHEESGMHLITEDHFCGGYEHGGMDTCQGDSGGAAMAYHKGSPFLAGVVSWGKGCGIPGYPGLYVRVSSYLKWISKTLIQYEDLENLS